MNSFQRVIATLEHQQPDRVPLGEWGVDHDHISKILGRHTYWRNRKDSTIALWDRRRDEVVESEKKDYFEFVEKMDYDLVTVDLNSPKNYTHPDSPKKVSEGVWKDSQDRIYKYTASNDSISAMFHQPAKEELTEADINGLYENINNFDDTQFEVIDYINKKCGKQRALLFRGMHVYSSMMDVFGGDMAHKLMLTAIAPEEIKKTWDYAFEYNKMLMQKCKDRNIPIVMCGYDYGTTKGCFMAPASFRQLYLPVIKRIAEEAKRLGLYVLFHCCGQIWDILGDFVDAGMMGYQSIQASAGMDMARIKKEYGDRLTLWTGIQCETLIEGTTQQVQEEVRKSLEICMPGGGFIFGSTNSVQYGAKTENYIEAVNTLRKFGNY